MQLIGSVRTTTELRVKAKLDTRDLRQRNPPSRTPTWTTSWLIIRDPFHGECKAYPFGPARHGHS